MLNQSPSHQPGLGFVLWLRYLQYEEDELPFFPKNEELGEIPASLFLVDISTKGLDQLIGLLGRLGRRRRRLHSIKRNIVEKC